MIPPVHYANLDRDLFRSIHLGLHRDWLDPVMLYITYSGDGAFQAVAMIAAAVYRPTRIYGLACMAAWLLSGAVRLATVQIVQRQRPSNYAFAEPLEPIFGNTSFPSGHTTTSFAIAVVVAWLVSGTRYATLGWLLILWATLVALSRVYIGIHYPADVLAGAALGTVAATLVHLWFQKRNWTPVQLSENPEPSLTSD